MEFKEIAKKRYATKNFTGEKISKEKITELLEIIKLSASSFGLQPYKILVIENPELKEKIKPLAFDQPQITTSSHLLVFCTDTKVKQRIDRYAEMISNGEPLSDGAKQYIEMMRYALESRSADDLNDWSARQIYIALGNAINGAKSLGFDSCPMEGFDPIEVHKLLELDETNKPVVMVAVGVASDTPKPKVRYSDSEIFEFR